MELRFMPSNADVQEGDLLTTSGVDGVYPPGLPVARGGRRWSGAPTLHSPASIASPWPRCMVRATWWCCSRWPRHLPAAPQPAPAPAATRKSARK